MKISSLIRLLTASLLVFGLSGPIAGANLILLNGRIATATGVQVGGNVYDVDFLDGICDQIFSGCNASSTYAFNSLSQAESASQALLDTVFLNLGTFETAFDSRFNQTNGCGSELGINFRNCKIMTPYGITVNGTAADPHFILESAIAINDIDVTSDTVKDHAIDVTVFPDGQTIPLPFFSPDENYTWARWRLRSTDGGDGDGGGTTTVAEPNGLLLGALGLLFCGWFSKRNRVTRV